MYNLRLLFSSIIPCQCLLCAQILDQRNVDQRPSGSESFCSYCLQNLPFIVTACPLCAAVLDKVEICGHCLSTRPYFDSSISAFEFIQPISDCIYKFKYQHQFYLGKILSLELTRAIIKSNVRQPDIIVPVPLHIKRLKQRGFNQSAMIARHISKKLKIPYKNNYLVRHKYSVPQIELSASQRLTAVKNAFRIKHKQRYRHIALVDDVVTTTHTVNQAAKALKFGGTEMVSVWSVARNT